MSRYAFMPDSRDWEVFPQSVFCEEFATDFSSLGAPAATVTREAWCARSRRAFSGWRATHHAITNHRITVDGDRATIRVHVRVEHWATADVAAGGPNCWLVVGFYDNTAVRNADGWRLSSITLNAIYQENADLLAASMAAVRH